MMRTGFLTGLMMLAMWGTAMALEPAMTSPHQDLLILGPLEPLRVRLIIEVNGIPFRKIWLETFERQFTLFDPDRKGVLTPEQAQKLLTTFQRGAPAVATTSVAADPAMMAAQRISRTELQRQLQRLVPPISVSHQLASRGAGPALIPLLDTDGDGMLSRAELSVAEQSLHCRDFNDDQLITQQELIAGPSMESVAGEDNAADGTVLLLKESMDASAVAEVLLGRYDRNRDGVLSLKPPAELISSEEVAALAVLDADRDEMLSRKELLGFLELPLDVELPIPLGDSTRQKGKAAARFRLRSKGSDGGFRLYVGSGQVDFGRSNRDPSRDQRLPRLRDFDANSNESLDAQEFQNVPDRPEFAFVDSDRDEKISVEEFDSFFLQQARIAASRFVLEVSDAGSDLFTTMDTNFDRVLTPRELKAATELLNNEDRDGDGYLGGVEMSYSLDLKLSRGGSPQTQNNLVADRRAITEPTVKVKNDGPAWFQKMDRNRDGDVSLLEFIGSRDTFQQLDKDGNQLLSVDELP